LQKDLELGGLPAAELMRFDVASHTDIHTALPFTQADYFALVDSAGRRHFPYQWFTGDKRRDRDEMSITFM
jgi:hypothetical protein